MCRFNFLAFPFKAFKYKIYNFCFRNISILPHNFKIVIGATNSRHLDAHAQTLRTDKIIIHPEFRQNPMPVNDIALVRLAEPVTWSDYVKPVCLPSSGDIKFGRSSHCFVAGWGISQVSSSKSMKRNSRRVVEKTLILSSFQDSDTLDYYSNLLSYNIHCVFH